MIRFINVGIKFSNGTVGLQGINANIDAGDFVYIVGMSGAGKSTFTKLLIHECVPTEGRILLDNIEINKLKKRQIPKFRRNIGFVYQDFRLLSDRTAYENVAFAGECVGKSPRAVRRSTEEALDFVGLATRAKHYPRELSGGEQQRVAIARALVNRPNIVVADEPTGNLDIETAEEVLRVFEEINRKGTTVIMATHQQYLVNEHPHRVLTLSGGRIVRDCIEGGYCVDVPQLD